MTDPDVSHTDMSHTDMSHTDMSQSNPDIRPLATDYAPKAIGPYAQAVEIDGWIYTSGQIALDPMTGNMVPGGFESQARQVLANLRAVLASARVDFSRVVKATIYLADLDDFAKLNELYGEAMGDHRPARSTVEVSGLPKGALVEIDLVARAA